MLNQTIRSDWDRWLWWFFVWSSWLMARASSWRPQACALGRMPIDVYFPGDRKLKKGLNSLNEKNKHCGVYKLNIEDMHTNFVLFILTINCWSYLKSSILTINSNSLSLCVTVIGIRTRNSPCSNTLHYQPAKWNRFTEQVAFIKIVR